MDDEVFQRRYVQFSKISEITPTFAGAGGITSRSVLVMAAFRREPAFGSIEVFRHRTGVPGERLSVEFTEQLCPELQPRLASRADGQVTCAVVDE